MVNRLKIAIVTNRKLRHKLVRYQNVHPYTTNFIGRAPQNIYKK